jgi:hypothetical protein
MADFHYIHEHPWLTLGLVGGGGFVLYLILHRSSSSSDSSGQVVYAAGASGGVDPTVAAQLAAAQSQIQGNISMAALSGQTQVSLVQIGAGVQSQTVTATQDVTNRQTDAQLQLGLGSIGGQVALAQIQGAIQMKYIDAIIQAFTGHDPVTNPTPTTTTPVGNSPGNPINTVNPPQVTLPYPVPTGTGGVPLANQYPTSTYVPSYQIPPDALPQILPQPNPSICSPYDATCIQGNINQANQYNIDVTAQRAADNHALCLSNAAMNVGRPGYDAMVAACG